MKPPMPLPVQVCCRIVLLLLMMVLPASAQAHETSSDPERRAARIDEHGRLIWHGKPIFINGWYSDGKLERLRQIAASPFNAVLDYGMTSRPVAETHRYLAEAEKLGVAVIMCVNDVYPSATYRKKLGSWVGNEAILKGVVTEFRNSRAVVAWYNNDELPVSKVAEIEGYHDLIARLDPDHPQLMVHHQKGGIAAFGKAADIFGFDRYPIPQHGPLEVAKAIARARSEARKGSPVWAVLQNFAWYQHRKVAGPVVAGDRESARSRLPTPEEWKLGRAPTSDEYRAMVWLGIVHGAQGLLSWCLYNLDYLPDREERWDAAVRVAKEVRALEHVLLEPGGAKVPWSDVRVHGLRKTHGGKTWIIAVNSSNEPLRVTCDLHTIKKSARALFERREVAIEGGKLTDFFAPYGRHAYEIAP